MLDKALKFQHFKAPAEVCGSYNYACEKQDLVTCTSKCQILVRQELGGLAYSCIFSVITEGVEKQS